MSYQISQRQSAPSLNVASTRKVEEVSVDSVSLRVLQIFEVVDTQNLMVGQVRLHFDAGEGLAPHFELLLQTN